MPGKLNTLRTEKEIEAEKNGVSFDKFEQMAGEWIN